MIVSSASKFYMHYADGHPITTLASHAYHGFTEMGAEVVPFEDPEEIDSFEDLGPEVGICGYIGDVQRGLKKLGKPVPPPLDYPTPLKEFLGRDIQRTRLGKVVNRQDQVFVKPVEQKLFTGFIWRGCGDQVSRRKVIVLDHNTEVYTSPVLSMLAEYRVVVLDKMIVDVRRYKGDYWRRPNQNVISRAVETFEASGEATRVYTLDFAVCDDGGTILVEANDGYAFGHYGMHWCEYAQCLAARWMELAGV